MATFEVLDRRGISFGFLTEFAGEVQIDDIVGEGGFSGARNAGQAEEKAEWKVGIEFFEVVAGGPADLENLFAGLAAFGGNGDEFFAAEPGEGALLDLRFEI